MRAYLTILATLSLVLSRAPARAEDNPEMHAAQEDLRRAKTELQSAGHDYDGHRRKAVEHVEHALEEVRAGLAVVEGHEKKVEHKEQRLEKRLQKDEQRDDNMKNR